MPPVREVGQDVDAGAWAPEPTGRPQQMVLPAPLLHPYHLYLGPPGKGAGFGQHPSWASWNFPQLHLPSEDKEQLPSAGSPGMGERGDEDPTQNPTRVTLAGGFTLPNPHLHPCTGVETTVFHRAGWCVCQGLSTVTSGSGHTPCSRPVSP